MVLNWVLVTSLFTATISFADVPIIIESRSADKMLTTEDLIVRDRDNWNPAKTAWMLERDIRLDGFKPVMLAPSRFGVQVSSVVARLTQWMRSPQSSWFLSLSQLPCKDDLSVNFSDYEGAKLALNAASDIWKDGFKIRAQALAIALGKISESTDAGALKLGQKLVRAWEAELDRWYRADILPEARQAEWKSYQDRHAQKCSLSDPSWSKRFDAPAAPVSFQSKILARLPSRRVMGMPTVRVSLSLEDKILNGRFFIDTSAPRTIVYESFLTAQGINPRLVVGPRAPQVKTGQGFGFKLVPINLKLGGQTDGYELLEPELVLIKRSPRFDFPEVSKPCCDGVLGLDILQKLSLEWIPMDSQQAELVVMDPLSYRSSREFQWTEVHASSEGLASRECQSGGKPVFVQWETSQFTGLGAVELNCLSPGEGSKDAKRVKVGMRWLGRGAFALDIPHGRIGFDKKTVSQPEIGNASGLEFKFIERGSERALILKSAKVPLPDGLKPKTEITSIDHLHVVEMDLGDLEWLMTPRGTNEITLEWGKSTAGEHFRKLAPIKLNPSKKPGTP